MKRFIAQMAIVVAVMGTALFLAGTAEAGPGEACRSNPRNCYDFRRCVRAHPSPGVCSKYFKRHNRKPAPKPIKKTKPPGCACCATGAE